MTVTVGGNKIAMASNLIAMALGAFMTGGRCSMEFMVTGDLPSAHPK